MCVRFIFLLLVERRNKNTTRLVQNFMLYKKIFIGEKLSKY